MDAVVTFCQWKTKLAHIGDRSYDYEAALKYPEEYPRLSIVIQGGIGYCPFCGYKLEKLWRKYPADLRDIIKEYESYDLIARQEKEQQQNRMEGQKR